VQPGEINVIDDEADDLNDVEGTFSDAEDVVIVDSFAITATTTTPAVVSVNTAARAATAAVRILTALRPAIVPISSSTAATRHSRIPTHVDAATTTNTAFPAYVAAEHVPLPRGYRHALPASLIYFGAYAHPDDNAADVARDLAHHYGWNESMQQEAELRIIDLRHMRALDAVVNRACVPVSRTDDNVQSYFNMLDESFHRAQDYFMQNYF
jgi:hypothetical protein